MTDNPDYRGFRIKDIHAIVAIGDDDEEGVPAFVSPLLGSVPLIAADPRRLEEIKRIAQVLADETDRDFEIVRFSVREKIGEIKSKKT